MPETVTTISNTQYAALVSAAKEAEMLKMFLAFNRERYCGLTHAELENLCVMLGIAEEKEDEE